MTRHVAAIAIALSFNPLSVSAQGTSFRVNDTPAEVHQGPSTVNPVIGTAKRGAVLEVTRELGSWVKVVWPAAADRVGYVHVSMGTIRHASAASARSGALPAASQAPARTASRPSSAPPVAPRAAAAGRPDNASSAAPAALSRYVLRPTHIIGVGGLTGGPRVNFGATGRAWSRRQFGLQMDIVRESVGDVAAERVTSTQFTPSVLYSLPSHLTESFWMRPYLGAGLSLQHHTLNNAALGVDSRLSEKRLGFQAFGGAEVTFAGAPRLALSADLGYQRRPTSFTGIELGGVGLSLSAHWYIK